MLTVSKIDWIGTAGNGAEVAVGAGDSTCTAFCHPCRYREGDQIAEPLHIFGLTSARLSNAPSGYIEKVAASGLSQRGAGRLVDQSRAEIRIGELLLVFDDALPSGIAEGEMIEFDCARIDLW